MMTARAYGKGSVDGAVGLPISMTWIRAPPLTSSMPAAATSRSLKGEANFRVACFFMVVSFQDF